MPQGDIERLLTSCDTETLDGAPCRAILLLLARLGLRSIEIARLQLEDLDWQAGDLLVRGIARRDERLPLPDDVGAGDGTYLAVRGRHDSRFVFFTLRAPIRADLVGGCGPAARCSVTATRRPPRSTQRSISDACGRLVARTISP